MRSSYYRLRRKNGEYYCEICGQKMSLEAQFAFKKEGKIKRDELYFKCPLGHCGTEERRMTGG